MSRTHDELTDAEVDELRRLRAEGWGWNRLANHFGCNETGARNIALGRVRNADGRVPMKPWAETSGKFGQGPV